MKEDPTDWKLIFYFIAGTVLYYLGSAPIAYIVNSVENYNTESPLFNHLFYRYYVNTMYFPLAQLIFYVSMMMIGFSFVVVVNLQNQRASPFMSRDGSFKDIKWTFFYAFVFFFASGLVVLMQKEDLEGYCNPQ